MAEEDDHFSFGKNWQRFLKSLNRHRFKEAEMSLIRFMGLKNLKGKTFLDIGCGSGLFSYAAYRLGAAKVTSFDVDQFSVRCCRYLHKKANKPKNWEIEHCSILNKKKISQLQKYDVVYSWGVLHHTGNMWQAISNAAELVKPGGYFYIAIYNNFSGPGGSKTWHTIKKAYNAVPGPIKWLMELAYMTAYIIFYIVTLRNPISHILNYKSKRGMSWRTDITDWIGGYPYEYATTEEIFSFMKKKFPDFTLENLKSTNGLANNWFLFRNQKRR
ncbi:class I SAM-dependent methyltransferase [Candidatus Woesearchaeota archaeon]|nr:class I SAM-dependent methyltransferase [Candidatus Woesearchaeota archaeon]